MILAAIPAIPATSPEPEARSRQGTAGQAEGVEGVFLIVGGVLFAVVVVVLVLWFILRRRSAASDAKNANKHRPPLVQLDLTKLAAPDESIDFVVPPLQSPRTLKAGAAHFEVSGGVFAAPLGRASAEGCFGTSVRALEVHSGFSQYGSRSRWSRICTTATDKFLLADALGASQMQLAPE